MSSPPSPRPFFLLLRSPKGLARLVTKARGLRWLRVRGWLGWFSARGQGKGKEVKPLPKAKGPEATLKLKDVTPKTKDVVPKAKDADLQSKEADPKAPNPLISQPGNKDNLPLAKA